MANGYELSFLERHERAIIAVIGIILLIFVFGLLWSVLFGGGDAEKIDCRADVACFVQNAQICNPATMERTLAGSIMRYDVTSKCTLVKSFSVISATEPKEIHSLFGGKLMMCDYTKGNFNQRWINTLTGDIATCTGGLRDALVELMSAQEELEVRALQGI